MSGRKRHSTSLDEARREIQELNQTLGVRDKTIAEEEQALNHRSSSFQKHNKSFHKLFPDVPEGEMLTHVFTCALQKEVLYHGKLYVSQNYVCFHSSVLLKDTKVVIPVLSVREVKKHSSALSMLSIQTGEGDKYSFVSLRNRQMCHKLLQSICSHAQRESPNSSPHLSSAENEADQDVVSSYSSLDDSVGQGLSRQHSIDYGDDFPLIPSAGSSRCNSVRQSSLEEKDRGAVRWIWSVMEKVTQLVFLREMSAVFYIYILLIMLLLSASVYIGLKIVALEEQLNSLGALTELVMHHREYQET